MLIKYTTLSYILMYEYVLNNLSLIGGIMNKKELLFNSGIKVISEKGFINTRVSDITSEASVSVGTYYNYFKDKEDFLFYVFLNESEVYNSYYTQVNSKPITPLEKYSMLLDLVINRCLSNVELYLVIYNEKTTIPKLLEYDKLLILNKEKTIYTNNMENLFGEGKRLGQFKDLPTEIFTTVIDSLILSMACDNSRTSNKNYTSEMKKFLLDLVIKT